MPTIKFLWGCSKLHHKVGYLPIDVVFQRYIQRCSLKVMKKLLYSDQHVISAREYYVQEEHDEDVFFFKPECKILPSIAFVEEKGPCVLTCSKHNGGTKLFMVHP